MQFHQHFYAQLLRTQIPKSVKRLTGVNFINVLCPEFFVQNFSTKNYKAVFWGWNFWHQNIGVKCVRKMLMKFCTACPWLDCIFLCFWNLQNLRVKCWWNWPRVATSHLSIRFHLLCMFEMLTLHNATHAKMETWNSLLNSLLMKSIVHSI